MILRPDVFHELIVGDAKSSAPVRVPTDYWPITPQRYPRENDPLQTDIVRCNKIGTPATETRIVSPGEKIGFHIANSTAGYPLTISPEDAMIYHEGPAAFYIAKAPGSVDGWDGKDGEWIKVLFKDRDRSDLRN